MIGKRTNEGGTTGGGPDVLGAAEVEVEGGSVLGRLGIVMSRATLTEEGLTDYTLDELIYLKRSGKELADRIEVNDKLVGQAIMMRMCEDGEIEHPAFCGQWVSELCIGKSADTISELRLVEHGVDPDVIAASREIGKSYEYVKITKPKAGKEKVK